MQNINTVESGWWVYGDHCTTLQQFMLEVFHNKMIEENILAILTLYLSCCLNTT